ncbi:MAG: hypothetical protein ACK4RW_10500 [Rehaibacterium terrae]|uniref:hypothetical protein n=1 Tax=Rehaibacterium terrae TaxID=1341696 RepID=UPI003918DA73
MEASTRSHAFACTEGGDDGKRAIAVAGKGRGQGDCAGLDGAGGLLCEVSEAQSVMEPIEVVGTAPATGGLLILCYSPACMGIVTAEQAMARVDAVLEDEIEIDEDRFCKNLRRARPRGCSYHSPPSVPRLDPGWVGNGCGDGSWRTRAAEFLLGLIVDGYTGDLNNPLPGVSFFGVCQAHDYCYGIGADRGRCDREFVESLGDTCQRSAGSYLSSCLLLAGAYGSAVVRYGRSAYDAAQSQRACALWALEMRVNQCPAN